MTADRHLHLDQMSPWNDRLHDLEVIGIVDEAPGVKTFTFRSDRDRWFRYRPGQFVTLELPMANDPLLRTYTLSSSPSRPLSIAVTAKAQADSVGTRWMFEHLRIGARTSLWPDRQLHPCRASGDALSVRLGRIRHHADDVDVALDGGLRSRQRCRGRYGHATVGDIIFRQELELLDRQMPNLSLSIVIGDKPPGGVWSGHRGRLDPVRLAMLVPDMTTREVFCCGPDAFMALVGDITRGAGLDPARYHQESFGDAPVKQLGEQVAPTPSAPHTSVTITFAASGVTTSCAPDQTVLEAARQAGIRIPAACEMGLCATCKVMKRSGSVRMEHDGGILDEEVEEGFILPCCSRPDQDLHVDV